MGTVGNSLRVEFTAVGDTVNLASRMESLAEPGTTWVTENTHQSTAAFFEFEALGEQSIKGKVKPVSVYRVISPGDRTTGLKPAWQEDCQRLWEGNRNSIP